MLTSDTASKSGETIEQRAKRLHERAIIVEGGRAKLFEDMDLALDIYAVLNERDAAA